jgi:hypothetical protein
MSWNTDDGKVVVGRDVDANQEFAAKYGVKYSNGIDFHNGEVVGKQVGVALSKLTLIV